MPSQTLTEFLVCHSGTKLIKLLKEWYVNAIFEVLSRVTKSETLGVAPRDINFNKLSKHSTWSSLRTIGLSLKNKQNTVLFKLKIILVQS